MTTILKDIIQPLFIILGGTFALYQYQKQQKFKRLQNLPALWKTFLTDEKCWICSIYLTLPKIKTHKLLRISVIMIKMEI